MSSTTSSRIVRIFKSRKVMLELLQLQRYNIDEYEGFSINEVDAMFANSQLDMLITHETNGQKVYVKYYFAPKQTAKQIRPQNLDEIIEDLYTIEEVLTKNDTLIVIIDDEPNDTILARMKYLYDHDGIFVIIHNIQRLQFNILEHKLVPYMNILTEKEVDEFKKKYSLKSVDQLPEISRFDPQALAVGLRPGQICSIQRNSETAMIFEYYRACV